MFNYTDKISFIFYSSYRFQVRTKLWSLSALGIAIKLSSVQSSTY